MAQKVLFTKSVDIIPVRKGIYKDPMLDTTDFRLLVTRTIDKRKQCKKETCDGCDEQDSCELYDKACGGRKKEDTAKSVVHRRRRWGEDPEFDAVMSNFGMTKGQDGEEVEQQLVFGFANVSVQEDGTTPFDWDGDTIDTDVLEAAAYNFVLKHGLANESHQWDTECGWLVESMMFTKEKMAALGIQEGTVPEGWFVGFYIPDPAVYAKVKNGEYNMFSIEGCATRVPVDGVPQITEM